MKRKIIIYTFIFICIILFFKNCGFQIGNVRIGKQSDLSIKQNENLSESDFYKTYYSKDKLIILNLWATWCEPCIGEIPILNEIKDINKQSNIAFLSISVDTDSIKLINFNKTKKFHFDDITLKNILFRRAIFNTLEGKKPDSWISSQNVPITYLIKNKIVLKKIDGTITKTELKIAIDKYK